MELSKVCLLFILSIICVHSENEVYDAVYCIFSVANTLCNINSDVTVALNNFNDLASISERSVKVYFTTETHYITNNFNFSNTVSEIALQGSKNANSGISKIFCQDAGLYISEMVGVQIINLHFENCSRKSSNRHSRSLPIGLFFSEVDYIELNNITISNGNGRGLYTHNCKEQVILNSTFHRNVGGNAKVVFSERNSSMSLTIISSAFTGGSNSGGLFIDMQTQRSVSNITIDDSRFADNIASHIVLHSIQQVSVKVCISSCTFSHEAWPGHQPVSGNTFGAYIGTNFSTNQMEVLVRDSNFSSNRIGGLQIIHATQISITNCLINKNSGTGLFVMVYLANYGSPNANIRISNSNFTQNSRALYLSLTIQNNKGCLKTVVANCNFTKHAIREILPTSAARAVVQIEGNIGLNKYTSRNSLDIEKSNFVHNSGNNGDCSSLHVTNMNKMTLNGVNFSNNNCTGITSIASNLSIANKVIMNNNHGYYGGAMHLESKEIASRNKFSSLKINSNAQLRLLNNKAMTYGGGIRTDETCKYRNEQMLCFIRFQSRSVQGITNNVSLVFHNNTAQNGGDSIFGGCLTNCFLHLLNVSVNASEYSNVFWNFTSIESGSQSAIAQYPTRVAFCELERCSSNHSVTVYRGQQFNVPLMVVDEACVPTVDYITANILDISSIFQLKDISNYRSKKSCANFSFSLTGSLSESSTRVTLSPQTHSNDISSTPTFLDVYFTSCPAGFKSDDTTCVCHDLLQNYSITCFSNNMSFLIPEFTWIGENDGSVSLNPFCKFCNIEKQIVVNIKEDSDKLCTDHRTGILCGSCSTNTTLLLGGYRCGECKSILHGIILTLAFVVLGIALILVLFFLNITVSNGVLSAVIFYCNVIHSNSDIFLPTGYNTNQKTTPSLQHTVHFLSTFQAWINLDFGIKTCYFNGYNTYISTWMQFVFPLYIWLLILLVVFASKYSSKVSKVTTSNTVPVLATLLLLSYAKLLITCLEVVSFARLERLDGGYRMVWILDGNIKYLYKKHVPLFLMSVVTITFYIIPFTLLILLGPLLQANSEYRFLRWINKLKPLLDAFYGPYTCGYRYWAGILLVARSVLFISTIYSLGDIFFKLMSTVALTVLLFLILLFISQREKTSIYTASFKNYLELSVFGNLALFSIIAAYLWSANDTLHKKQVLAVVMIGVVFITFCGILLCYTLFKYKLSRNVVSFVMSCIKKNRNEENASTPAHDHSTLEGCTTTHSTLAMTELREPLLHDRKTE